MTRTLCAVLGLMAGLALGIAASSSAEPEARPLRFETEREAAYWDALVVCRTELDGAQRRLVGEQRKVASATVTVTMSCPAIPACPPCASDGGGRSCLLEAGLGGAGGLLVAGLGCALLNRSPSVVVTH